MNKLGVTLPPNGQVGQAQFLEIVKKFVAANITPIAQGVGAPMSGSRRISTTRST